MISGASEEELIEAIGRADVLLEFMPKIKQLQKENKQLKEVINKAIEYIEGHKYTMKHYEPYGTPTGMPNYETCNIRGYYKLLDILKEVENG